MFEFNLAIENSEEEHLKSDGEKGKLNEIDSQDDQGPVVDETLVPCGCISLGDIEKIKAKESNKVNIEFQKISLLTDSQLRYQPSKYEEELDSSYIHYVDSYRLDLGDEDLIGQVNKTHDVVTGQYEGGLKVWELCIDLARLVYNIDEVVKTSAFQELKGLQSFLEKAVSNNKAQFSILELGCGHALPSLAVIKHLSNLIRAKPDLAKDPDAVHVSIYLQDFNKQVIENITYENVKRFLTHEEKSIPFKVDFKFAFGDWHQLLKKQILPHDTFDLILTSETIYNSQNYKHLLNLFQACMIKPVQKISEPDDNQITKKAKLDACSISLDSVVLLAAKSIYFGCGGNLHDFLKLAKSSKYCFKASIDILEPFYRELKSRLHSEHSESTPGTSAELSIESNDDQTDVTTVSKEIIKLHF